MFGMKAKRCEDLEQRVNERVDALKKRLLDQALPADERTRIEAALKAYEREVRGDTERVLGEKRAQDGA